MAETCTLCPALCASRSQIVYPDLPKTDSAQLLVIGEAPGADEDLQGKGFVGRAGVILHSLLSSHGLHRGRDYGCANIVRCRPPDNRKPTAKESWNCLPNLLNTISEARPKVLLLVGGTASSLFFGAGSLSQHILQSRKNPMLTFQDSKHPLHKQIDPLIVIPMPHTSPLAWNRNAPDGTPWSQIGQEQVQLAARLFHSS